MKVSQGYTDLGVIQAVLGSFRYQDASQDIDLIMLVCRRLRFEPGGREFDDRRARHLINDLRRFYPFLISLMYQNCTNTLCRGL